jgi:hypothetical protein
MEWMYVVLGFVLSFYISVRLVTWLMVKISSFELFLELRRELEPKHRPPSDMPWIDDLRSRDAVQHVDVPVQTPSDRATGNTLG